MRRIILCFIFFPIINSIAFSQTDTLDYKFLNFALKKLRKQYKFSYFQLFEQVHFKKLFIFDGDFSKYYNELKGKIDSVSLQELNINSLVQTNNYIKLDENKLENVKMISGIQCDSLQEVNKSPWRSKTKLEQKFFFIISYPIFNSKKSYAFIDFGGGTAWMKMSGARYLFKKIKNKWVLIAIFNYWSS